MNPPFPPQDTTRSDELATRLQKLERHSTWVLASGLLVASGVTLASFRFAPGPVNPETSESLGVPYVFMVGLSGLVALFSLYMLFKQGQLKNLRSELIDSLVREEALRARLSGVSSLFEGITQLGVQVETQAALRALAEHVRVSLVAERTTIFLLDEATAELHCAVVAGNRIGVPREKTIPLGEGIEGAVARDDRPFIVSADDPTAAGSGTGGSGLCVPLALPNQVIGVLRLDRTSTQPPFTPEDARIVGLFASHTAIAIHRMHERERAQETLRQKEDQLRQSHKMEALGRLAGGVAHDFNNILTVILASSTRLLRGLPIDEPLRANAEKISDAAERCAALTRQLLTFSRKQVVEIDQVDLNQCVEGMSRLLRRLIGENVELVLELGRRPVPVLADRSQIEQVVLNLTLNARDALPHGGRVTIATDEVRIDVSASEEHGGLPAGNWITLTVTDTGFGMDAETRARLFEPFFTTKGQGTGLGLATVYGVVQQSGGTITVNSRPGQGSVFCIYLPRASETSTALTGSTAIAQALAGPRPRREATILIAEDQDDLRELVRETLQGNGYRVIEASWAGEAVILADAHEGPIHLLLTDVVMPGESGEHLAQWMAQVRPEMPVLFMSGYTGDEFTRQGASRNGGGFIQKPFTEEALLSKIAEILERAERAKGVSAAA